MSRSRRDNGSGPSERRSAGVQVSVLAGKAGRWDQRVSFRAEADPDAGTGAVCGKAVLAQRALRTARQVLV